MRLALNLGYLVAGDDPAGQLTLARTAEECGFDSVWAAEAYGSDVVSTLAWIGGQTSRIGLGSAVMQIPARTPAMTAMTAATLDLLTGGRFRLGLGVSGPQVSEGWHGVRFAAPLGRTEEYLDVVQEVLSGRPLQHSGRHHTLPLPDGPGVPLRLTVRPVSEHIPTYLAAVGPKNLELAGRRFDGWLGVFVAPDFLPDQLAPIAAGRGERGLDDYDVVATVPLVVAPDPAVAADPVRSYAALYLGGMGSREQNFYNQLAVRMGYGAAAQEVQDRYLARETRAAMAAVPQQFIDETSLLGDENRLVERLGRLAGAGVTTCAVTPFGRDLAEKQAALRTVAAAHARL